MKNWPILLMCVTSYFMACGPSPKKSNSAVGNGKLTCLVLGYDSLIYYTGTSDQMLDVNNGKITDSAFIRTMFMKIKHEDLPIVLKPGGGSDVGSNFQEMIELENDYGITKRSVASGDKNDSTRFSFVTPPIADDAINGEEPQPLKLFLPKQEPGGPDPLAAFPKSAQLVIFLVGEHNIYAYLGGDIKKGNRYTYEQIEDLVAQNKSEPNFSVVIKPTKNATYKATVNILDVMTLAKIKHFALIDITTAEEEYLYKVYQSMPSRTT